MKSAQKNKTRSLYDHLNRNEHKPIKIRGGTAERIQLTITPGRLNIQLIDRGAILASFSVSVDTVKDLLNNEPKPLTVNQIKNKPIQDAGIIKDND